MPTASPKAITQLREATELLPGTPSGDEVSDEDLELVLAEVSGDVDLAATAICIRSPWVRELLAR